MLTGAVEYLYSLITEVLTGLTGIGAASGLSASIGHYSNVYNAARNVGANVSYPIASQILAIYLAIELVRICMRALENGGSAALSGIMRLIIKFMVCYNILLRWRTILVALFDISKACTSGIASNISAPDAPSMWQGTLGALEGVIGVVTGGEALVAIVLLLISLLIVVVASLFARIIIVLRFINLYILLAFAPIPMATLMGEGQWNLGVGFLKNWLGACFHGCVLFFVLQCYSLFGQYFLENSDSLVGACMSMIGISLLLVVALFSTERIAMKIFGA